MSGRVTEADLQQKEAELEQVIHEYYNYDMSSLKAEINRILQTETSKVDSERQAKLTEIARKFSKIMSLGSQHVVKGSRHKTKNDADFQDGAPSEETDEQLLQQFTEHSDQYESQVREANLEKQAIR